MSFTDPKKNHDLNFIGNASFIQTLEEYSLGPDLHNKLVAAYICTVLAQSQGIRNGSFFYKYVIYIDSPLIPNNTPHPKSDYHFTITDGGNITSKGYRRGSGVRIFNKQYEYYHQYSAGTWIDSQAKHFKSYPQNTPWSAFDNTEVKIEFSKRSHKNMLHDVLYDQIIGKNSDIKTFINYHFLSNSLKISIDKPVIKIKI